MHTHLCRIEVKMVDFQMLMLGTGEDAFRDFRVKWKATQAVNHLGAAEFRSQYSRLFTILVVQRCSRLKSP